MGAEKHSVLRGPKKRTAMERGRGVCVLYAPHTRCQTDATRSKLCTPSPSSFGVEFTSMHVPSLPPPTACIQLLFWLGASHVYTYIVFFSDKAKCKGMVRGVFFFLSVCLWHRLRAGRRRMFPRGSRLHVLELVLDR